MHGACSHRGGDDMDLHIHGSPPATATPLKTEARTDPSSRASVLSFDFASCAPASGVPMLGGAPRQEPGAVLQAHSLGSCASDSFLLASRVQPQPGAAAFVPCSSYFEGTPSLSTNGNIAQGGGQSSHRVEYRDNTLLQEAVLPRDDPSSVLHAPCLICASIDSSIAQGKK